MATKKYWIEQLGKMNIMLWDLIFNDFFGGNRLKVEFDSQGLFILFYFFKLSFRKKNIYMSYELFYVEYFEPFISKTILADIFLKTTCYSF